MYSSFRYIAVPRPGNMDAWHLLEHVLVAAQRRFLLERGNHLFDIIAVKGETFEEVVFFSGEFYTEKALADYELFWKKPQLRMEDVQLAVKTLELEERSAVAVDEPQLLAAARRIAAGGTSNLEVDLRMKKTPRQTVDVRVDVVLDSSDAAEQKIFLRLRPPLLDAITAVVSKFYAYDRGAAAVCQVGGKLEFSQIFTVPSETSLDNLQKNLQQAIDKANSPDSIRSIRRQYAAFAKAPLLKDVPIEYFRNTGIITSVEEIAELATRERLARVLDKLEVSVALASEDDYERLEN